jgi:hypothetical protein
MNSWALLACYPRGTFYPMSDGPSTRDHRITNPYFRTCSTCRSRSQAPLCVCALSTISVRAEGTLGRLRYFLGGDRPSQTAHQTLSQPWFNRYRLVAQYNKGGISRMTPPELASRFQRLPPILHILHQTTVSGYSKGPRGLSVLLQVVCIFTNITISPSPSLRQ